MKAKQIILVLLTAMAVGVGTGWGATNEVSGLLQKGLFEEEANHNLDAAIQAYQAVVTQTDKDHQFAATAIFRLGECYRKQGKTNEANAEYQRIVGEFPDQTELATLSRQQLGKAAEQTQSEAATLADIKEKLEKRRALDFKTGAETEEIQEIKGLQAMLRDSPDLLNIRVDSGGMTRLHKAAATGQLAVAKFLLDNGADVNARDRYQDTPLHGAVQSGRKDMVELLLSRGAKADVQTYAGKTPLHLAAENGFKAIAELLLAHGAAVDAKSNSGETAGETALHEAAHAGNGAIAELLLANKADVNARDVNGGTPLYIAAEMGHPAVIELLLAHGADINALRLGMTPLMKAIAQNNTDTAKMLLQHGADIKIQVPTDSGNWPGWAALEFAVDKNNAELVKLLLEKGADANLKVKYGKTPLIAAVEGKELGIAKLLLERGAEVNSKMADDAPFRPRWTALTFALAQNDNELVKLLLENHADPNETFDVQIGMNSIEGNSTPLMMAVRQQEKEIVKILLAGKADVNLTNSRGETALWRAFSGNNRNLEIAAMLLENKADTETKYSQGRTILSWAAAKEDTNFAELLLAHGAKANARDDAGETPLHLAAFADSLPMVELLLAHGADVNAKDNEGNTPLDSTAKPRQTVKITERDQIRALLREHGGVAEVDIATIRVMRNGKLAPKIIFRKDRGGYNHFTLFELIANMYGEAKAVYDPGLRSYACAPEAGLEFPDFGKLKIIHLAENGRTNVEVVDLEKALAEGDCSKNISLKWGDVMEVPETDHKVTDVYGGLSQPAKDTLSKCLAREVEIRVKGQITKVKLSPDLSDARTGGHGRTDYLPGNNLHDTDPRFWLNQAVHSANVILASSDLTRVRVKRAGVAKEMVFNLEKMEPNSDLWLEDGDVIEIPEKAGE